MITTIDGTIKKRGERAWEISSDINTGLMRPPLTKMTGKERNGEGWPKYYNSFKLCQEQCDLMNQESKI